MGVGGRPDAISVFRKIPLVADVRMQRREEGRSRDASEETIPEGGDSSGQERDGFGVW